ncbi:AraC family transcriptional regulator [Undibacterium sp. TJN19]|uniref:AraC family transcriptional regulator n=1 Tax=Undibacterium sp. TJN19 TaxID=3413055 RepID=UPI003BF0D8FC
MYRTEATPPSLIDPVRADQAGGSILFAVTAMSQARATPAHSHQRGQLLAATAGVMTLTTEQQHLVVPPGYAIWLPPMNLHAMLSRGQFSGWSIYVAPDSCTSLPAEPQIMPVSGLLREAVLRAATWAVSTTLNETQERVLAVILDEVQTLPRQAFVLALPSDKRILKITTQILNDPGDQRSLQEWADWAGIAQRTLIRRFAQETGLSFSEWRQRARLMRAIEMLTTGTPVTTIAIELGYDSLSAFIAMFKRQLGVPPSLFVAPGDVSQADTLSKK